MGGIPNTSKSPYYLRRIESRGPGGSASTGDTAAYSLRSIPAWDPGYLGSSLLAKRLRKTLALIEDRINAVATGGVDYALLEQMVNNALAGMNLEGLSEAEVNALIAAAVNEFSGTLTAEVGAAIQALVDGGQLGTGTGGPIDEAAVQSIVDAALAKPLNGPLVVSSGLTAGVRDDTAQVVAFHPDNKPVSLDLQSPGGQVTVNGQKVQTEADVIAKVNDILSKSPIITSPNVSDPRIGGTVFTIDGTRVLSLEHANENTWLKISNGQTGPEIGVKPLTGSTIDGNIRLRPLGRGAVEVGTATSSATVRAVGDLTPDIDLVLGAQGDGKVKIGESPVVTEKYLADNIGPALQAAIQSQVGKVTDRMTLNLSTPGDGAVVFEANSLTGAQHKVGVDFRTQRDGEVTVNGKRVLTTDDALEAGGAGIDQVALEAAVDKATAELRGEIGALRSELMDYKTFVAEQFGNFNDVHENNYTQTAQLVLAEQAKLQRVIDLLGGDQTIGTTTVEQAVAVFSGLNTIIAENIVAPAVEVVNNRLTTYLNALAGKPNPTPTEVRRALDEIAEYAQQVEQWANQTISDVVDYVAVEFTKYTTKDEFAALNAELEGFANEAVPAMVQSALEDRIPAILEALQTHLENVLAIFGGGGTTGVTPAQITELTAEFARLYATKDSLAAYAKLDDGNQEINAGLVKARGVQFTINDEVLVPLDYDDYGTRLSLIPKNAVSVDEAGIVVVHTDLTDLVPGKKEA